MKRATRNARTSLDELGPGFTEADIEVLEKALSRRLPDDYRDFLLTMNGGVLGRNAIKIDDAPWSPTNVFSIFGINRFLDTSDLQWNMQTFLLPSSDKPLLPVACDSSGNPFCLAIGGDEFGSIVFIDLDNFDRLYRVAPTFSAFVSSIHFIHRRSDCPGNEERTTVRSRSSTIARQKRIAVSA